MKVLHIITDFDNGGAQAVLYRFVAANPQNDHHVISLMTIGSYGDRLIKLGIKVDAINLPGKKVTIAGLTKLYRLIKQIDPDVIQTWMYHSDLIGSVMARLAGKKVIVWGIHNSNLDPTKTALTTRLTARACGLLSGLLPQQIISCSEDGIGVHTALGYQAKKMVVVPNGYDVTEFSPQLALRQQLRSQWPITDDTTVFGLVARWDPQKDHPNLIAALAHLQTQTTSPWHCVLVGSSLDSQNKTLVDLLAQHGVSDRVSLLGIRNDIPAVMNAIDLHVLPSSYGEAFPNVVSEAMACGAPCIVTQVGDAALIVGDTGWAVPPRDPIRLAAVMLAAVAEKSQPTIWATRQAICRERIELNFNLQIMVTKYNAVWQDALVLARR